MSSYKPLIGIPMGDPAGIGPEIVLKALKNEALYEICRPVVVGIPEIFERNGKIIGTGQKLNCIEEPEHGKYCCGTVDIVPVKDMAENQIVFGEIQAEAGKAAYASIVKATALAREGRVDAMATTPIHKEAIKAANVNFIGHTEMLGDLTHTADPLTMFQVFGLRVFFLSRHVSLRKACDLVTKDRLVDYLVRCDEALARLGLGKRCIAVAGLNPHSGEHGLFGDDEMREVEPAVAEARARGLDVVGPVSADSVFYQALKGKYDAVLSLYHDQGHIATKTLDFERTIALTIGLPFLRTSVDHGTALDIAGQGIASAVSMEEAIRLAAEYGLKYKFFIAKKPAIG